MSQPPTRDIIKIIFTNILKSFSILKKDQLVGKHIGSDYFGNKYFEIAAERSLGRRRQRWFEPPVKEDFAQEMPAEWESWLRGRRDGPPKEEEVMRNVAIMDMKKQNAIEVEKKAGKATPMVKGYETFPKYSEYERSSGKPVGEK